MAITFPRPMFITRSMSQSFEPQRVDYLAPTAARLYAVSAGWPLWTTTVTFNNMMPDEAAGLRAWIDIQRGPQRTFAAFDIDRVIPFAHQDNRPFRATPSGWSQAISGDGVAYLTLEGLLCGQVVSIGDYVGFIWDTSKLALVRACETVQADADGTAVFAIEPPVWPSVPGDAVVNLKQASCLMRLVPGDTKVAEQGLGFTGSGSKISAVQDLVA